MTHDPHTDAVVTDWLVSAVGIETAVVLVILARILRGILGLGKKEP
jgi:hypothetical protein